MDQAIAARLSEQDGIQYGDKILFVEIADNLDIRNLNALFIKKQYSRRAEEPETLEQFGIIRRSFSDVDLNQLNIL